MLCHQFNGQINTGCPARAGDHIALFNKCLVTEIGNIREQYAELGLMAYRQRAVFAIENAGLRQYKGAGTEAYQLLSPLVGSDQMICDT